MADIRFYHTMQRTPQDILPELLEKARAKQQNIVVRVGSAEDIKTIDDYLWTYSAESFLPHGCKATDNIFICADAAQSAPILFLLPNADETIADDVTLCCKLFDGRDEAQVVAARTSWKMFKDTPHTLTYWQQSDAGKWEQKA